jgi:hypothetical protein
VLRRLFGPKLQEVTGRWIKLHSEELHGLYSSSSSVAMGTSKSVKFVGHVAHVGEITIASMIWFYNRKEIYHVEEFSVDGRIILKIFY